MTTIAWDGKTLAADSQISNGDLRVGSARKIGAKNGVGWGAAGDLSLINAFLDWCERGAAGSPPAFEEGSGEGIIIHGDLVLTWSGRAWDRLNADVYAIGTGRELAHGVLAIGGTAQQAVQAAISRDRGSGGRVRAISVR